MEFVVNGTKGGFRTLYSTPSAPSIGSDIRNNVSSEDAVGKSLYALAFLANGCAFTKYIIVRDTLRSYSTGTIAFSLFLPFNKELANKGADVKSLLDKISLYYSDNYIIDNNINRGETLIIQEDWSFVDDILHEYREQDKTTKEEELLSGSKDAAVIYYKNDVELLEYLDKPYQEEYSSYRQILLIDNDLQGKSIDPINILRSSGDELNNIDLKNEKYYLIDCPSKYFTITANGKPRSDRGNNNYIRAKWPVEIRYSKDDLCFEPIEAKGTISNPESEISKFLKIEDKKIYIRYEAFNNPIPKTKAIIIKVKKTNGDPVADAIITYKNNDYSEEKTATNNIITFKGEEIKERWLVSAKKENESLISEFKPVFPLSEDEAELFLHKQKVITLIAIEKDSGNVVNNFKVKIKDGPKYREKTAELVFIDTDIEKTWRIEVSKKIGLDIYYGIREYCPADNENPLRIELDRKTEEYRQSKKYFIDAGKHGKKTQFCPPFSKNINGSDIYGNAIKPNKGYYFNYWEVDYDNNILIAQYKKKNSFFAKKSFLIGVVFVVFIALIGLCIQLFTRNESVPVILTADEVKNYIQGEDFTLKKLQSYQTQWESQSPKKNTYRNTLWYNPITWFGDNNQFQEDSDDTILLLLNESILTRDLIDQHKFKELADRHFFPKQDKFKKTVENIDRTEYDNVVKKLGDVSSLTLNQIADSIKKIINRFKDSITVDSDHKETRNIHSEEKIGKPKPEENKLSTKPKNEENNIPVVQHQDSKNSISEIAIYLKGSELKKEKLIEYKNIKGIDKELKASIQLCLDFWELDGCRDCDPVRTYYSFIDNINEDKYLNNSCLKAFLVKVHNEVNPGYSDFDKIKGLKKR